MPRDEAWVWHEDEQHEKYEKAKAMIASRLCVFCKARSVDEDRMREGNADFRGMHFVFERPGPES